jgi:L-fucose isomerase-like protein
MNQAVRLGLIPANRGFFSDELARQMRAETIAALTGAGVTVVVPTEAQTKMGCVETWEEAMLCGRLFREQDVDGIVVAAANFGDEQAVALAVREARLPVPVLIFGGQEQETLTLATPRRDAFCGLLSIAEALRQVGVKYTVAQRPIGYPRESSFAEEVARSLR